MMKIAVVASNGKASRAIIEELVARGHEVTAFARHENQSAAKHFVQKDILDLTKGDLAGFDAVVDVMALPSVASDARIALYASCGGLRAHRPRAACAADSDSLVFASDRFSCPMRVPMLYYFLYHDIHKKNKSNNNK